MPALYKLCADAGKLIETVRLVDWKDPDSDDFAIAGEVALTCSKQPVLAAPTSRLFQSPGFCCSKASRLYAVPPYGRACHRRRPIRQAND